MRMDRRQTKYNIVDGQAQPDGPILVKIKKQYNDRDRGEYFN